LLHILPKGFVRIRHFGLLANRYKKVKVDIIRKLQGLVVNIKMAAEKTWKNILIEATGKDPDECPNCCGRLDFAPLISSA